MSRIKSAMTKSNMAILGAFDEFYDVFKKLFEIYDDGFDELILVRKGKRPDIYTVNKYVNKKSRNLIESLLKKYSFLFVSPPETIHASAYAFSDFTLFEYDDLKGFKPKSFQNFLYDIQYRIAIVHNRYKQYNRVFCTFEDAYAEINEHIIAEVEKTKETIVIKCEKKIDITNKPLYVFEVLSSTSCHRYKHAVITSPFYAPLVDGSGILVLPTHFCQSCDKYLIGKNTLSLYDKSFGKTLIERRTETTDENSKFNSFNIESLLHQLGYNVIDGELSETERHNILIAILTTQKMTYFEICQSIEQNIRLFDGMPEKKLAVTKWRDDLKYLGDYVISHRELK